VVLRGSVLSRVLAPVLSAALEPDVVSTVPPLLQVLEVLPRLEQVRTPFCIPPLCCVPVLPRLRLMCTPAWVLLALTLQAVAAVIFWCRVLLLSPPRSECR